MEEGEEVETEVEEEGVEAERDVETTVFDISERGQSRGTVAVKVDGPFGRERVLLMDKNGNKTAALRVRDIGSVYVLDNQSVRLKKSGSLLSKVTLSFQDSSFLETFIDRLLVLRPSLERNVFWKGDRFVKKAEKSSEQDKIELAEVFTETKRLLNDDENGVLVEDSSGSEDEDEGNDSEDAHGGRSVTVETDQKSLMNSLNGTEWRQYFVLRYNKYGQGEAASILVAVQQDLIQILSHHSGETLAAYRISEVTGIILHGYNATGMTLQLRTDWTVKDEAVLATFEDEDETTDLSASDGESGRRRGSSRISHRARLSAQPAGSRRSGVMQLLANRLRRKSSKTDLSFVSENLVFQQHEDVRGLSKMIKRERSGEISVSMRKTLDSSACIVHFQGGWQVFRGLFDRKKRVRTLAINPFLGVMHIFRRLEEDVIPPEAEPIFTMRVIESLQMKVRILPRQPSTLGIDITKIPVENSDIGLSTQGSFDTDLTGIRALKTTSTSPWKFVWAASDESKVGRRPTRKLSMVSNISAATAPPPGLQPLQIDMTQAETFSFAFNCMSISEANRLVAAFNCMRLAAEVGEQGRTKKDPVPGLAEVDAAAIQMESWSATRTKWFTREQNFFVGTFNVGDASPPRQSTLAKWIPEPDGSGKFKIYAVGLQEVNTKFEDWTKAIGVFLGEDYELAVSIRMWEIGLLVFIHFEELPRITSTTAGSVKTGLRIARNLGGVQLGNKGGVGVGFRWRDVPICFINAHLSAHQHKISERNRNFSQIMGKLTLEGTVNRVEGFSFEPTILFEHLIFMGDLNYRINLPYRQAENATTLGNFTLLHSHDQLTKEMKHNRAFVNFKTATPDFPPTYRWKRGKKELSNKRDQPPSYTDRVLWHSKKGSEGDLELDEYTSAEDILISDHRPVGALFRLQLRCEYSWPYHPITVELLKKSAATKRAGPQKGWVSDHGDFFIPATLVSKPGMPQFHFRNFVVQLFALDDGRPLPSWIRVAITSGILHSSQYSTWAAGSESSPDMRRKGKKRFAYQGVGAFQDLFYAMEGLYGLPQLVPIHFDPLHLKSQHLMISLALPNSKELDTLSAHHMMHADAEDEEDNQPLTNTAKEKTRPATNFRGQASISLQACVEAVQSVVSTQGLEAWSRESSPQVSFSEPLFSHGFPVGKIFGEVCLLPAHDEILQAAHSSLIEEDLPIEGLDFVKQGWVQMLRKQPTSARVFFSLYSDGSAVLTSKRVPLRLTEKPNRNVLLHLDLSVCEIESLEKPNGFRLSGCRILGEASKPVSFIYAVDGASERDSWLTCIESIRGRTSIAPSQLGGAGFTVRAPPKTDHEQPQEEDGDVAFYTPPPPPPRKSDVESKA